MKKAVISLSGGLDSTCLLMHLLQQEYEVRAYSFFYGQKHSIELEKVKKNIEFLQSKGFQITHQVIDLESAFSESASSLKQGNEEIPEGHYADENMKSTVVENRNIIFSSIVYGKALGWANKTEDTVVITLGLHAGDHCFTEDTNILTAHGIKTVKELTIGDKLPSFNTESKKWEFKNVTDIIKKGIPETVTKIETSAGAIKLTDEHKVYRLKLGQFDLQRGYEKSIEQVPVEDLVESDFLIQPTNISMMDTDTCDTVNLYPIIDECLKNYVNPPTVLTLDDVIRGNGLKHELPQFVNKKAFVSVVAWYIAEGWSRKDAFYNIDKTPGNRFKATFRQSLKSNLEKADMIATAIRETGFDVKYDFSKKLYNNPQELNVYTSGLLAIILQSCGSHSAVKQIPEWLETILLSNSEAREEFLYIMGLADGYNTETQYQGFCSSSEKLIKQIVALIQLSGYHFTIDRKNTKCTHITYSKLDQKQELINLGDAKFTRVNSITVEPNNLNVYDITVEDNHNFVAGEHASLLISNSIYPDCRPESQEMARELFRISNWNSNRVDYIAPFVNIDKGAVLQAGISAMEALRFKKSEIKKVLTNTHTCYNPDSTGASCGKCGSCTERLEAFDLNNMTDPIAYQK